MQNRVRVLMGASALLYFGPLLAGLSGMGWDAVPVFVALFALWLVVMRPAQWPRDLSLWSSDTMVAAAAQLAVNILIVIALFAAGRGIGGVAGFLPNLPPFVPVGLSFLATPLSRLIWDPAKGDAVDRLMADTIQSGKDAEFHPLSVGPGDAMVETLLRLPTDADPDLVAEALDAALRGEAGQARLSLLEQAIDHHGPEHFALRRGLILWATAPSRSAGVSVRKGPATAFALAGAEADLLELFALRGACLLQTSPTLAAEFPKAVQVTRSSSKDQPVEVQEALRTLAALLPT